MAIPAALQAKLDEYEKQEQEAQSQQATDETVGTSFDDDFMAHDDAPDDVATHDDDVDEDTNKGVADDDKSHTQSSESDENFKRMEGRYKAHIKRLESELEQLRHADQGNQSLMREISALKQEIVQLKASHGTTDDKSSAEANDTSNEEDFDFDVPDDSNEMYGDIKPILKTFAKPLINRIKELEAQQGHVKQRVIQREESDFIDKVRAEVPNFNEASSENVKWQAFLSQNIPFTGGLTMRDALTKAHESRDIQTIKSIFNQFELTNKPIEPSTKTEESKPETKKGLEEFATPDKTAVNQKVGKKYKFRQSDYMRKSAEMKAGLISKEEFMAFDEAFSKAESAGLVSTH